nr:unnamed protein product [Spirometra erinaceieuropaei]
MTIRLPYDEVSRTKFSLTVDVPGHCDDCVFVTTFREGGYSQFSCKVSLPAVSLLFRREKPIFPTYTNLEAMRFELVNISATAQLMSSLAVSNIADRGTKAKHVLEQAANNLWNTWQISSTCQRPVPLDFEGIPIVHLYKRRRNRKLCNSLRGSTLINAAGKIIARILLNRPDSPLEQGRLSKSQYGFRRHCGLTDMIFAVRQLQEKHPEMQIQKLPKISLCVECQPLRL